MTSARKCGICRQTGHTKNECHNPNYGKRLFRGAYYSTQSIEKILENHDLSNDFLSSQDLKIDTFLQKAPGFKLAGTVTGNDLNVSWESSFDKNVKDVLYIITVDGYVVKYGMTETSLPDRHQSLKTGKEEYTEKNSVTNRRSRPLVELAVLSGKEVKYYAAPLPSVSIVYPSIDGTTVASSVSPTREEEKKLYEMIVALTNGVQPILNVQVPGGKKK